MKFWIILTLLVCCAGCQSITHDGASADRAVRLQASDHGSGLTAEHEWLKKHFPGFRLAESGVDSAGEEVIYFSHRSEARNRAMLSVYTIQLPDGRVRDVFFDQSAYFGKDQKEANSFRFEVRQVTDSQAANPRKHFNLERRSGQVISVGDSETCS